MVSTVIIIMRFSLPLSCPCHPSPHQVTSLFPSPTSSPLHPHPEPPPHSLSLQTTPGAPSHQTLPAPSPSSSPPFPTFSPLFPIPPFPFSYPAPLLHSGNTLTPPHPPPHHRIHTSDPLPTRFHFKPLPMLLPAPHAQPLNPFIRELDVD